MCGVSSVGTKMFVLSHLNRENNGRSLAVFQPI